MYCQGVMAVLLVGSGALAASREPAACPDPALTGVLAHVTGGNTVSAEIREKKERADGYFYIDMPRMIGRLKALHAYTYNYLVWNSPSDFDDLRKEFLPAAQKRGSRYGRTWCRRMSR